ncbi:sugar phosphate isomerase/epimerase family protein [Anaerocolumna xylanovorans]|uniref:Sugar phosphate isomerase/epimerase n=1 Tax=Anaerocolumna xylanovorans DSM 12503 TaxID=1121345 RepID=A0A1M7Y5L2_9FIRM|nr:sugar phosphate isomerase/epimerase family protein [Anaerocolumna xylanovorans]SHO47573.1 Sugar phosphate isomerase/epimerase [Anaerocolumna xylanovorans DSM 12503]
MKKFLVGVILESFKKDYITALNIAHELGVNGVQMYATDGELSPDNLKGARRNNFLKEIKSRDLCVSAIVGDFGLPFTDTDRNKIIIEKSKRILDLAKDLDTNIVTTHIGTIPEDERSDTYKIMQEACFELSEYANRLDAHFAIETGPEPAKRLKKFLDKLPSNGVAVNYDPANLVMVTKDDPVQGVYTLKDYIVHTHAKDGKPLGLSEAADSKEPWIELPLGQGNVDFPQYIKALEEVGYRGFLTIEREVGMKPAEDIAHAVSYLNKLIEEN